MLLRRVVEHVKAQNWFAVGIDFLIVVVGVFIGIQVSNWNQQRFENALADSYLVRIEKDLRADIETLEKRIFFWDQIIDFGASAIEFLESDVEHKTEDWPLVIAFYQASQIWKYDAKATTFDELRGGGQLGLINNAEARFALSNYYEDLNRRAMDLYSLNPEYRRIIRSKTPYPIQTYIWENCHYGDGANQRLIDCPEPELDMDLTDVLESYAADPEILESLRFWIVNLTITRGQGELEIARLEALSEKIGQGGSKK